MHFQPVYALKHPHPNLEDLQTWKIYHDRIWKHFAEEYRQLIFVKFVKFVKYRQLIFDRKPWLGTMQLRRFRFNRSILVDKWCKQILAMKEGTESFC